MEKLSSDLLSLQAAADVAFIKENLRLRANRQLIWALIILVQALGSYPRFGSFVALGACVVLGCEAMWLLRVRQPRPVLAAALLLWATAAWNLYLSIAGFENGWIWVLLYAFFGSREYRLYRKFRLALATQTPQSEAEVARITTSLRVPDPDVIEPHIRGDRWLVRLFTNCLVLRNTTKGALLFASRETTRVAENGNTVVGEFRKVSLVASGRKLPCSLTPEETARLLDWYAGTNREAVVAFSR
jgi:hypothetical protein